MDANWSDTDDARTTGRCRPTRATAPTRRDTLIEEALQAHAREHSLKGVARCNPSCLAEMFLRGVDSVRHRVLAKERGWEDRHGND
jgi:hypothetical protein